MTVLIKILIKIEKMLVCNPVHYCNAKHNFVFFGINVANSVLHLETTKPVEIKEDYSYAFNVYI